MITVVFPKPFERVLSGQLRHSGQGSNVKEVLSDICSAKQELKKLLFSDSGQLQPSIAFFIERDPQIHNVSRAEQIKL